jgi:copper chaperone CopZ
MDAKKLGITSALLVSACCVGPILLVLLGLGGIGLAGVLGRYHWHMQGGAVVLLSLAWWVFLRERRKLHGLAAKMKGEKVTMTTLGVASAVVVVFLLMSTYTALSARLQGAPTAVAGSADAAVVTLPVKGMTCLTCELTVKSALKRLDGVAVAEASAPRGTATVKYDPAKVTLPQMIEAVNATGYKAELPANQP